MKNSIKYRMINESCSNEVNELIYYFSQVILFLIHSSGVSIKFYS